MDETSPLDVCMGSKGGASFNVRAATPIEIIDRRDGVVVGKLAKWRRVLVRSIGVSGTARVWVIEPGPEPNEIAFGEFHVRGRFAIVDKSNNVRKVEQIWKKTPPA